MRTEEDIRKDLELIEAELPEMLDELADAIEEQDYNEAMQIIALLQPNIVAAELIKHFLDEENYD